MIFLELDNFLPRENFLYFSVSNFFFLLWAYDQLFSYSSVPKKKKKNDMSVFFGVEKTREQEI